MFQINDIRMYGVCISRLLLILLLQLTLIPQAHPKPGHMVHDYYKCQSEFFKNTFLRCKEERKKEEEEERIRRDRQRNINLGCKSQGATLLQLMVVTVFTNKWLLL